MKLKTYIIEYDIYLTDNIISDKKIKVKNCENEMYAKTKLDTMLKNKYSNYKNMVIHKCTEDILSMFNGLFGNSSSNPFAGFK